MKVKTSELEGVALDYCVAKTEGNSFRNTLQFTGAYSGKLAKYRYSADWAIGGPIIEREGITVQRDYFKGNWQAWASKGDLFTHSSAPLIAAMRCYVASKLGDEVEIPDELIGE